MLDVAIVGAGVSGLVVARRLRAAGARIEVVEARDRVGGRAWSVAGHDLGPSWVWDTEHHIHALLRELDLTTFPHHREGLDQLETPQGIQRGRLPGSAVPERRVRGGPAAIAERLARGIEVSLAEPVEALRAHDHHVSLHTARRHVRARQVVAALPPAVLCATVDLPDLADDDRAFLASGDVWMADVAKIVAVYPRRFWRDEGLSGHAASLLGPMSEVHDLSGPEGAPAALFGFVHRQHASPGWRDRCIDQLARLFGPRAGHPSACHVKAWWEDPFTAPAHPPQTRAPLGHPSLRTPRLGGRLHLCSTETSAIHPGHLDGAVARAEAVARQLLAAHPTGAPQ